MESVFVDVAEAGEEVLAGLVEVFACRGYYGDLGGLEQAAREFKADASRCWRYERPGLHLWREGEGVRGGTC